MPGPQVLSVGGIPVAVEAEGAGPPLVLVHSLLTGPEAFARVATALADEFTVYRVSLPGFGASAPLANPDPTVEDIAGHIAATMDQLGCGPDTTVLGNGLGGFVVAALAADHGEKYGKLVLTNSGAAFPPDRTAAFHQMSDLVTAGGMAAVVDVAVRRIFPDQYLQAHPEVIAERRPVIEAVDPGAFAAACRALARFDLRPRLGEISNPTLVLAGAEDATTPPEMARELAAALPNATFALIPECGHCPQLQHPEALLAALRPFVGAP